MPNLFPYQQRESLEDGGKMQPVCMLVIVVWHLKFIYGVCVCVGGGVGATVHGWRSEDNIRLSLLSFYHVCPRNQTQDL